MHSFVLTLHTLTCVVKVMFTLSNIHATNVNLGTSSVGAQPDGIHASIAGVNIGFAANW